MNEDRIRAEGLLDHSDDGELLEVLVDNLREVLFVRDPIGGRMLFVNPIFEEIWGIPRQALYDNPRVFVDAIVPEDRAKVFAALEAQDRDGIPFDLEYRIRRRNGEVRHIAARAFFVRRGGRVHRVVGLAWDLTARRKVEDELRELKTSLERQVEARTAELEQLVCEKNVLLAELNHRVKNTLQLVSSLLQLQRDRTEDPVAQAVLDGLRTRIQAVAAAHEHLARRDAMEIVLDDYARKITSELAAALGSSGVELMTRFETGVERVSIERAIPFGLLLNELLTNAYRHAFPDGVGMLRVTLSLETDQVLLEVADDGPGVDIARAERTDSLGLRLVRALVEQLNGTAESDSTHGLAVRVRFARG